MALQVFTSVAGKEDLYCVNAFWFGDREFHHPTSRREAADRAIYCDARIVRERADDERKIG